ncbi:PREDICTED: facilitated trehalose transporter Tret1-like [Polistes dominula]|uniref:Facilitated trehalose transporter Tret1-like n=1 Tax=Polistes dominula TaxID=743375 RepID=A0ABM1ICQ3_POLDO|nr:PREDICTED: facilitated trehalose transporter Tret1-like [Polistes dominula]
MAKNNGISNETLVFPAGQTLKAKKLPQLIASFAVSLGAVAAGLTTAWPSQTGEDGIKLSETFKFPITPEEFSWIGSLAPLGAAVSCVPIGKLSDIIGRKYAMLLLIIPFTIGWLFIIFASSVIYFYIGRFLTGFSGGAFCVMGPMYTSEISESKIRGSLGTFYQLFLCIGMLMVYALSKILNIYEISIMCGIAPLIFGIIFFFMPETPTYYLMKDNETAARESFKKLRGSQYNIEPELSLLKETIDEIKRNNVSFRIAMRSKACKRAIIISYGLMTFQQLCGVNAIAIFITSIFEKAGGSVSGNDASIVIGGVGIIMVGLSSIIVDRFGRKIIMIISIAGTSISTFLFGLHFYFIEEIDITNVGWLPIVSVISFIISFGVALGPLPWMMISEYFAPETKGIAASSACLLNWVLAFIVTKTFINLNNVINTYGTFWVYTIICALGIPFVILLVPETKGKSLEQIQRELSA